MAFKRRGRRMFRRVRRGRMRPTTEAGARFQRCHFNLGVTVPVSPIGDPVRDAVQVVSGQSLQSLGGGGATQALAVARVLQNPLKDYEVVALQFDVEAVADPGTVIAGSDLITQTFQAGFAVYTQRIDVNGAPVALPPYHLSQWPVNQDVSGFAADNEDRDYATRTHFHRAWSMAPHIRNQVASDPGFWVVEPGWPRFRFSRTVRIKRRIGDQHGVYFGLWTFGAGGVSFFTDNVFFIITGSLWYKMKF